MTTTTHTHEDCTWQIPDDLIAVQRAFDEAHDACVLLAGSPDTKAYQAARRDRLDAVLALHRHPWLKVEHAAERAAADAAMKDCARRKEPAAA